MTILAVIPARYGSSRFSGKPLALIAGKPMIVHVWERVCQSGLVDEVTVATDDERIAQICRNAGIDVVMTSPDHKTGTDRLGEVARKRSADIYVNVQGDEPLIAPSAIDAVVKCLQEGMSRDIEVATAYLENATAEQEKNSSVVHLLPTLDGCAMYFTRLPIPTGFDDPFTRTVHVGLYAFTESSLGRFINWERGPVERAESIELLRFLEHGERIACVRIASGSIGVDHPEDIERVEEILNQSKGADL